ncbi:single-stranded DNA-binding protein [Streptosporangium sp. NPDC051023]|uniref:single-stranded DNA-binding protein n=1 Tax=Streptosporangium sp. NPDC051023 TaxID=3155410 RepID=UPI00344F74BF
MDRNEVTLVGRLPEAVRIRSLQSGSTLGTWRMIVRRQQRGRGGRVDTIPCASFEPEVTVTAAEWLPDDMVEVVGSLRRRWWGSDGSKSSGYEVEVRSARRLGRPAATVPADEEGAAPVPVVPRAVRSLLPVEAAPAGESAFAEKGETALAEKDAESGKTPLAVREEDGEDGKRAAAARDEDEGDEKGPGAALGPEQAPTLGPEQAPALAASASTSLPQGARVPSPRAGRDDRSAVDEKHPVSH